MARKKLADKPVTSAIGRPTVYGPHTIEIATNFLENYESMGYPVPTHARLSRLLGITRTTLYAWAQEPDKAAFSDILTRIMAEQESKLLEQGLIGAFKPEIAKLMLGKHGYHVVSVQRTKDDTPGSPTRETVTTITEGMDAQTASQAYHDLFKAR